MGISFLVRVSYSIVRDIRRDAFANSEEQACSYLIKRLQVIVSRSTNDTETISDMFSPYLALSRQSYIRDDPYTMLVLDYRLTVFSIALPTFDFPLSISIKKSVNIIEKN